MIGRSKAFLGRVGLAWVVRVFSLPLLAGSVMGLAVAQEEVGSYVGTGYKQSWARGQLVGQGLLPRWYPGFAAFLGSRLHRHFGFELGFERQKGGRVTRVMGFPVLTGWASIFHADSSVTTFSTYSQLSTNARIRFSAPYYVDLNAYYPVVDGVELTGHVGLGRGKLSQELASSVQTTTVSQVIQGPAPAPPPVALVPRALNVRESHRRAIWRVGLGLQYMPLDSLGVRGLAGWESYSNFGFAGAPSFKGNVSLTAGAFYKF